VPKRSVSTDQAAPPGGPYSQAIVAGDTVYLAGAIPALPDGTRVQGRSPTRRTPRSAIWPRWLRPPVAASTRPSGWGSTSPTSPTSPS